MHLHIQMWVVGNKLGSLLFSFFTSSPHGWKRGWQEELLRDLSHQGCSCIAPGKQHPFESQQEAGTMAGCLALGKHKFPGCEEAPPPPCARAWGVPLQSSHLAPCLLPQHQGKGLSLPSPHRHLGWILPSRITPEMLWGPHCASP